MFAGIAKIESSGRLLKTNKTFLSSFGYTESEMAAFSVVGFIHRNDRELWQDIYNTMLHKSKARAELRFVKKDGSVFHGKILLLRNTDHEDRYKGYYFFLEDITEAKQGELSADEQQQFASSILDSLNDEIAIIDETGEIIAVNKAWNSFLLRSGGELKKGSLGSNYLQVCENALGKDSMGASEIADGIRRVLNREVHEVTTEYACNSLTEKKWFRCKVTRFSGSGRPKAIITHIDITDNKIFELNLQKSEDKFRSMVQNSSDVITIVERDGTIRYSSPSEERILGYKQEERTGQNLFDILHPDDVEKIKAVFKEKINVPGAIVTEEAWIRKADDTYICMETVANNLLHDPNVRGIVMNSRDVTDRKYDEEMIKAALAEKEALLKEVHHRVKNNLQMVISLLNLQENHIKDEAFKSIFHESINRMKTMSTIHQNLYHEYSLSHINFGKYLEHIVGHLKEIYDTEGRNISCRLLTDNVQLNLETAIPCGLLVNEILSNAMQHAFKFKDSGEILIKLKTDGGSVLTIEDNGIGLKPGIDPDKPTTLGFELIKTLSNQLNADVDIFSNKGTRFVIRFNNLNYRDRFC